MFKFNQHNNLRGYHAIFNPSKYSWLNYDEDKIIDTYIKSQATQIGTKLHEWAKETIDLGLKQQRSKKTLYSYVNDAIGFNMKTEVVLYYSPYFYGTADAITFKNNKLRIHDLKTGTIPAKIEQLEIYAALFCLEYEIDPKQIDMELRIYQNDEILVHEPDNKKIKDIMTKIIRYTNILNKMREAENG